MIFPWPADLGQPFGHGHCLSAGSCSHHCLWVHTQGSSNRVRCVWVRHTERWGVLWASWGDLQVRCSQQLVGRLLGRVHNAVSRLRITFITSESYLLLSHFLPTPKSCSSHFSTLDGVREMSFFSSWGGWVLTHTRSHFPP